MIKTILEAWRMIRNRMMQLELTNEELKAIRNIDELMFIFNGGIENDKAKSI